MKLTKIIIPQTRIRTGIAYIRFSKYGAITISKEACEKLGIQEGDKVDFYRDEDKQSEFAPKQLWYIGKSAVGELIVRKHNKTTKSLILNSSYISTMIAGFQTPAKYLIAGEPSEGNVYAILHAKNLLDD